jgi:hypothetical protein
VLRQKAAEHGIRPSVGEVDELHAGEIGDLGENGRLEDEFGRQQNSQERAAGSAGFLLEMIELGPGQSARLQQHLGES